MPPVPPASQGEHRSSDKSLQRASARLLAALTQGETAEQRLAMPLLVLLAQQRKLIVLQSQVGSCCADGIMVVALVQASCIHRRTCTASPLPMRLHHPPPTLLPCSRHTSSSLLSCTTSARRSAHRCAASAAVLPSGYAVKAL